MLRVLGEGLERRGVDESCAFWAGGHKTINNIEKDREREREREKTVAKVYLEGITCAGIWF